MRKRNEKIFVLLLGVCWWTIMSVLAAAPETGMTGTIVDAETGETLPFVQVYFEGSTIGTTSDMDGHFEISNTEGYTTLHVSMMGFKTQIIGLRAGKVQRDVKVKMEADTYGLDELVVTPKTAKKEKYRRKGNPAIELVQNVIHNKNKNRLESQGNYQNENYEKLIFSSGSV